MPAPTPTIGQVLANMPEESRGAVGRAIIQGLKSGGFTFTNPVATEGGDYNQSNPGDYTQSGGGNHNQGGGGYNQSKLLGNLGRIEITDLGAILAHVERVRR